MKILCTLLLITFSFASFAQGYGCRSVKQGKFSITDKASGTTRITRTRNTQIEENIEMGIVMLFDLVWIDECTYTLRPKKMLKGDPAMMNKDIVLTTVIKEVHKNFYTVTTSLNVSDVVMSFKVDILE